MHDQPAPCDGELQAGAVFRRRALVAEQERAVDLLDINPAILDDLESLGVLQETACSLFRIGVGPVSGIFI